MQYDYLIVGAGLYGAVFAHEAKATGKTCLVVDKRDHIAGNIYTETATRPLPTTTARSTTCPST